MKYIVLIIGMVAVLLISCNRNELFEREQYKAVVAIKSSDNNFFTQILDLNTQDEVGFVKGFISANVGGSLPTKEKIVITMTEDPDMLNTYNLYNFETDARKYYRFLPKNRYKIPEMKITVLAGQNAGYMPIWINANGLSPDSIYIIPFRVVSCSAYEMNPEKSFVYYRIERRNNWSYTTVNGTTLAAPTYQQRGRFTASQADYNNMLSWLENPTPVKPNTTQTVITKDVYLVSHNELRVLGHNRSGVETGQDPAVDFPRYSINIRIENDGKLTITPWREDHIAGIELLQQVDDDNFDPNNRYLNTYELITDDWGFKFHVFRLCYDYIDFGTTISRRMWEELRLEYVEDLTKK